MTSGPARSLPVVLQTIREKPGLEYQALARECYRIRNLRGMLTLLEKKGLVRVERVNTHPRYFAFDSSSPMTSSSSSDSVSASTSPARS